TASKKSPGQTLTTKERFTKQDMEFIFKWLEHQPNFESVVGSRGQTTVVMPNRPTACRYATLAEAMSKQSKGWLTIDGKNMREWFQRHMNVYINTKAKAKSTDFGATEEDTRNGVYTVAHKLESMCACYARMDALFGHRPKVTPV
ncbi:MAG: hypothetical protein JOS17DRAFT_677270, partial [Linnemannia elongata]